jgi:hypothetical protein
VGRALLPASRAQFGKIFSAVSPKSWRLLFFDEAQRNFLIDPGLNR